MDQNPEHFLWCEKYRPQVLSDCILPESTRKTMETFVSMERIPNLLLYGPPGSGKTTAAKALCNMVGADWMMINGSSENGIDVLRTKLTSFASTVSFSDSKKVTIIDEADYLNANSIQPALRSFTEEFSSNHTIIMTCNYRNRIIEPLHSRFQDIDFKIPKIEQPKLAAQFFKRVSNILELENVEYDKKVLAEVVNKFFPDFRRCLNQLQKYAAGGKIDVGILSTFTEETFNALIKSIRDKKFNEARKWIAQNNDIDSTQFYRMFYDTASEKMEVKSIPELIMNIAQYQYQTSQVTDPEIQYAAFVTQLMMSNLSWK